MTITEQTLTVDEIERIREAAELARIAAPYRHYPGSGCVYSRDNRGYPDAEFRDWGLAHAAALLLTHGDALCDLAMEGLSIAQRRGYTISKPDAGWREESSIGEAERRKLRPIAETLAMLDGNAFFGMGDHEHYWSDQYLSEAAALYEANGGDSGWAGEASFAKAALQPQEEQK